MSDDIRQNALSFEAVKVSMNQDKNGIILRLNVHPNDCPKELHTDWVGTRYMVAMVRLYKWKCTASKALGTTATSKAELSFGTMFQRVTSL